MTTMTTGGIPTRPRVKPTHSHLPRFLSIPMEIGYAIISTRMTTTMVGVMQTKPCANLAMLGLHSLQDNQGLPTLTSLTITPQT